MTDDDDDDDSLIRPIQRQFSVDEYAERLAAPFAVTAWAARRLLEHHKNLPVRVARSGKQFRFKKKKTMYFQRSVK